MKRKSRIRVRGEARAMMMLCRRARQYWRYYSPLYKQVKDESYCTECDKKVKKVDVDHSIPLGKEPRYVSQFGDWLNRLFFGYQIGLCKRHHKKKTKKEREARKKANG